MRRQLLPAALLSAMALVAASASAIHVHFSTGDAIDIRGDLVVLTPDDGPQAEIFSNGELRIDGHAVALAEQDRRLFARYNRRVHSIEKQAIAIGIEGAGLGISALGIAVTAVLHGEPDAVERQVRPQAERLKEKARQLCDDVRFLRTVQDKLADDVPAFRPYAMIEEKDQADCHVDD